MGTETKQKNRARRHKRVRAKVKGTHERPRLSVFRSARHIYAQLIDDQNGVTLLSMKGGAKADAAFKVGEGMAKKALEKGVKEVVFDRGGFAYHGRVKALGDGARTGGLKF